MKSSPSDDIFPWISAENPLRYHKLRLTAGVPISVEVVGPWIYSGESPICQYGGLEDGSCVDLESCEAVCKPF